MPKANIWIIEVICFLLLLNFFYEGIHKIAYLRNYGSWVKNEPLIRPIGHLLKFTVPIIEIGLALSLLKSKFRVTALYSIMVIQILFILWIISVYLFTGDIFWPYHAFWSSSPTWMQKMAYALLLSWLAYALILLSKSKLKSINQQSFIDKDRQL